MTPEKKDQIRRISCCLSEKLDADFELFKIIKKREKSALVKAAEKALQEYQDALYKLNAWANNKIQ